MTPSLPQRGRQPRGSTPLTPFSSLSPWGGAIAAGACEHDLKERRVNGRFLQREKIKTRCCTYRNPEKKGEIYRSLNFSTTRTLSPRTVIGIGTTLS